VRQRVDVGDGGAHAPVEEVEADDRRDGDEQADRRRHQRLGDARHDHRHAARLVGREIVERLDDAEDGAEEADEGGVVAERTEEGEVALEAHALARFGAEHGRAHRFMTALDLGQARAHHPRLDGVTFTNLGARLVELVGGEQAAQVVLQRRDLDAMGGEEPAALDHDGDADHRQGDQQPEHPLGAVERESQKFFGNVHGAPCLVSQG
jgi:hypothetical protein